MYTFKELCEYTGVYLDLQLEQFYLDFNLDTVTKPLVSKELVVKWAQRFLLSAENTNRLLNAINEIEADEKLYAFSLFVRDDMCNARHRCDLDDYRAMYPTVMQESEIYSFVMLLSCVEPSLKRVEALGVPEELYIDIPFTPMKRQMEQLNKTCNGTVKDFPWDMNFYTCSIFLLDRFYFIPFKLDDNIVVYKNKIDGEVITAFAECRSYRADGQLSGTNKDNEKFGQTVFEENNVNIALTPINPCGIIEKTPRTLIKSEWQLVLQKGDILLGFHIPGGKGYDPQHLCNSLCMAKKLFAKYFPEISFKGFGSESWLYDPHIRLLLPPESNIVSMQNKMYIYPLESGDNMMYSELFGKKKPIDELAQETSLQKKAKEFMKNGGRFTASGMFILASDAQNTQGEMYTKPKHIADAMKCMEVQR